MLVVNRDSDDPNVIAVERPADLINRLRCGLRQYRISRDFDSYAKSRPRGYELFSDDRSELGATLLKQIPDCDIINLHWVPGLIDYGAFFGRLAELKPVVWTVHDMNSFTGGCHYALGCDRYTNCCGACPQLGSRRETDLSREIWRRKNAVFSRIAPSRLTIVSPSRWLADQVKRSSILSRFPVEVIPYGLNTDAFAPRSQRSVRDVLDIPHEAKVVLFVAEGLNNHRKGFGFLCEALNRCAEKVRDLVLVSLGSNKPNIRLRTRWIHVGSVTNDRFLSMVYNVADVFAICSLQDNLPNTVLEAMACGVPIVGVGVGGITDIVRNGENGITVDPDPDTFAVAVARLLNNAEERQQMKDACRRGAVERFSLDLQAQKYAHLYGSLSANRSNGVAHGVTA